MELLELSWHFESFFSWETQMHHRCWLHQGQNLWAAPGRFPCRCSVSVGFYLQQARPKVAPEVTTLLLGCTVAFKTRVQDVYILMHCHLHPGRCQTSSHNTDESQQRQVSVYISQHTWVLNLECIDMLQVTQSWQAALPGQTARQNVSCFSGVKMTRWVASCPQLWKMPLKSTGCFFSFFILFWYWILDENNHFYLFHSNHSEGCVVFSAEILEIACFICRLMFHLNSGP